MKKKILATIICLAMLLTVASSLFLIIGGAEGNVPSPYENIPAVTERSIFPDSTLSWQSFKDYIYAQAVTAMERPEAYIGYEACFMPGWESIFCRAGFSQSDSVKYVGICYEESDVPNLINVDGLRVVIVDYKFDSSNNLWYKVEAPEGETLPPILENNPYIYHIENLAYKDNQFDYYPPAFIICPLKAMFLPDAETVTFKATTEKDSPEVAVDVSNLPLLFDVFPVFEKGPYGEYIWSYYDLGDIALEYTSYRYVSAESVVLIPAETSVAYEKVLESEDNYEYYSTLREIPEDVKEKFSDVHKAQLDKCIEALDALDGVKYETFVDFNGVKLPVTVMGNIPDNVTLSADLVSYDDIVAKGFDVKTPDDHIVGLDIKLINPDSTIWQPKEGRRVYVSIGVGALGYRDESVLKLQHKHGENIESFDVTVVENGAVTVLVSGFSIFQVQEPPGTTSIGSTINPGATIELEVGNDIVFYRTGVSNPATTALNGTWEVIDLSGAIHYTVYSQTSLGHDGMYVPWITINALKEATNVRLVFHYRSGNNNVTENYTLNIVTPKADKSGKKLYLKDEVNTSGSIIATLVDQNGNEIENGLAGASFSWHRSDDLFIVPEAYGEGYRSVNIARDHGGLVEARRNPDTGAFEPVTYTVEVVLSDSTKVEAKYTVYYQSEIVNANFEMPKAANNATYTYFPNGWPELYWLTTAPGSSRQNGDYISMDIEYGTPFGDQTGWGITQAADGTQFAEINCEAFGALYQDIITAPGEDIVWEFAHAPRQNQNWGGEVRFSNAMFIVIGATEAAQELSQDDLLALGQSARAAAGTNNTAFESGKEPVKVKYPNNSSNEYYVWYHDAGEQRSGVTYTGQWTQLGGSYTVPGGQYRTRLFFVSRPYNDDKNNGSANAGNLIDKTKGGQYKKYLIEYYEQTYVDGKLTIKHLTKYDETGEALMYASNKLKNYYDKLIKEEKNYLHHVTINGNPYPYDIRYSKNDPDNAYLYIEKYAGTPTYPIDGQTRDYSEYDIVMQLFFRDTVVAVQKQLVFPSALSEEQKNDLMKYFRELTPAGYETQFKLFSTDEDYKYSQTKNTYITQRDPSGNYKAFVALGDNPELGHKYQLQELDVTPIPGLVLNEVKFQVQLYKLGVKYEDIKPSLYLESQLAADESLLSLPFELEGDVKIADVVVINTYKEIDTVIVYHGVGNGKIKIDKAGSVFEDAPSETIPFYSGRAEGCSTHAGAGATFVGWFKDEACKIPVTAEDGVWDKVTGSFIPNANVISAEAIHFYAKFETGSITINRVNAYSGQTFVYHVQSTDEDVDMYVPLECNEEGVGAKVILEVPLGKTYNITEYDDWSWRYTGKTISYTNSDANRHLVYEFDSESLCEWWLNGYSEAFENVFGKQTAG